MKISAARVALNQRFDHGLNVRGFVTATDQQRFRCLWRQRPIYMPGLNFTITDWEYVPIIAEKQRPSS
jgi:hypothetical protein